MGKEGEGDEEGEEDDAEKEAIWKSRQEAKNQHALGRMTLQLISGRRWWRPLLALILASALCCAYIVFRVWYARQISFQGFIWNLFLAWVPLGFAIVLHVRRELKIRFSWPDLGSGILWLLFFPNAPYIVTDLVHLHPRPGVPYWYDIIGIMAFAMTGLFLGYLSLYLVQEVVRDYLGRVAGWVFALGMLALSSFGIYLGRFLRWNSWDALLAPLSTIKHAVKVANPFSNPTAAAFSATFFGFALVCYLIVYSFTHLERRPGG